MEVSVMPTATQARQWLDRWDRQQERYVADREERFAVIADVIAATVDGDRPRILDLGCGPGSLSVRLLDRFPAAAVVAVDADPLLLGLARSAYSDRSGLRIVERDLRADDWVTAVGEGGFDAVVSTTALHWLTRTELTAVYARCAELLRPSGVLIDGDHLDEGRGRERLQHIARHVEKSRAERVGVLGNEEWEAWWQAVDVAPELADLAGERGAKPLDHSVPEPPTLDDHVELLTAAGFAEVGTVWQHGTDRVLVAVR